MDVMDIWEISYKEGKGKVVFFFSWAFGGLSFVEFGTLEEHLRMQ